MNSAILIPFVIQQCLIDPVNQYFSIIVVPTSGPGPKSEKRHYKFKV